MIGGFYCPHCKEFNACSCDTCNLKSTDRKRVEFNKDGESMTCAYCGKIFTPDQAMDTEFEIVKRIKNEKDS